MSQTALDEPGSLASSRKLSRGTRWFLAGLAGIAVLYAGLIAYHLVTPRKAVVRQGDWLERCRETCLAYGLIPTGNIRRDAEAWLAVARKRPLTEAMISILEDRQYQVEPSQSHPLIGQPAPPFTLPNHLGEPQTLETLRDGGPIIVVFYYGYGCTHCVAQLIAIDQELDYFRQLGARVIAISSDSPAHTRDKYKEYGEFHFPVLSDEDNAVATLYGAFTPAQGDQLESRDHGTFVIDHQGIVRWANIGPAPYLDNRSLLLTLADAEGLRLAPAKVAPAP